MNCCPHCKVEINEHEATRCLDAWIAYKILGQSVELVDHEWPEYNEPDWIVVGEVSIGIPGIIGPLYVNKYSTNIQAAWLLVTTTKEFFEITRMTNYEESPERDWWEVGFANSPSGFALTPELAICRAAIKAKGKEDERNISA